MTSAIRLKKSSILHFVKSTRLMRLLGLVAISVAGFTMANSYVQAAEDSLSHHDKKFLIAAAEAGNTEVAASKIALEKSGNPDVKSFAEQMISEHTKVGDDLKKLAASKNVTVPDEPNMMQKAKIGMLQKRDGASFDKHYAEVIGISAHKDTVALFEKETAKAKDADIKQFAVSTLPALQQHLSMAKDLKAKVEAKK